MYLKEPYRTTDRSAACKAKNAYPLGRRVISGQRYLHTELGRWTRRDPIGEQGGSYEVYQFLFNNPLSQVALLGWSTIEMPTEVRCYFCAYPGGLVEWWGCRAYGGCDGSPAPVVPPIGGGPVPYPPGFQSWCSSKGGWPGFTSRFGTMPCDAPSPVVGEPPANVECWGASGSGVEIELNAAR